LAGDVGEEDEAAGEGALEVGGGEAAFEAVEFGAFDGEAGNRGARGEAGGGAVEGVAAEVERGLQGGLKAASGVVEAEGRLYEEVAG